MKRLLLSLFVILVSGVAALAGNEGKVSGIEITDAQEGGCIVYRGKIGQYPVEFTYCNLHMPGDPIRSYRYTNINVNNGEQIELEYKSYRGDYIVLYEYINGKHTGTFTVKWTQSRITGTFRNSKGKTYKVNAVKTDSNWADMQDFW